MRAGMAAMRSVNATWCWSSPATRPAAGAADVKLDIQGDQATAVSTTAIGSEVAPGGDRWTFAKQDGRWWITGLTYNLEPE